MWQWMKTWLLKALSFPYKSYLKEIAFISGSYILKFESFSWDCWILVYQFSSKCEIIWCKSAPVKFPDECFHCINRRSGSFGSSLCICHYISELCSIFLGCPKKTILSISSTFHILAHTLRVFSGHSASLFGNFDNLPNLDIFLILGFFYINLTRRSGKLSQNCLSWKAIQLVANALSIL